MSACVAGLPLVRLSGEGLMRSVLSLSGAGGSARADSAQPMRMNAVVAWEEPARGMVETPGRAIV